MEFLICGQIFSVSKPKPEFDDLISNLTNRKVIESPIITFFCKTHSGQKVALNIHKFYPKFYLEVPSSCPLSPLDFLFKLESSFMSAGVPIIHSITQVNKLSVYGFQTHKTRFFQVEVYNAGNIKRLVEQSLDGIDGFNFQPYEAHIDTFQHFYAEFGVSGMDWIKVQRLVLRQGSDLAGFEMSHYSKSTRLPHECDVIVDDIDKTEGLVGPEFGDISISSVYKIWKKEAAVRRALGQGITEKVPKIPNSLELPQDYSKRPEFLINLELVKEMPKTIEDFLIPLPDIENPELLMNFEDDVKLLDDLLDISKPKAHVETPSKVMKIEDLLKTPFQVSAEKMAFKLNPGRVRRFYFETSECVLNTKMKYLYRPRPPCFFDVGKNIPMGLRVLNQAVFVSESSSTLVAGLTDAHLVTSANLKYMPDFATRLSTIISKTDIFSNQYLYTPAPPSYSYIFSQSQSSTQDSNLHPIRKNIKETVKIDKQILSLCIMFLEVFIRTREDLRPDPKTDPIEMIALKIRDDLGKSKEIIYMLGTSHFNYKGKHEVTVEIVSSEKHLLRAIVEEMQVSDPDVVISFEAEKMGIGYLIKRSNFIWKDFVHLACRQPQFIVQQTYRYKKLSSLLPGRIILSCWRLIKSETHFYSYTLQNLVYCCLNLRFPSYSFKQQTFIFDHRRIELVEYIWDCLEYSKKLVEHFGILERNVTLAQIYGIDYESVFTRGSQFRVEAMLKKQVKGTPYLLLSAMKRQVSSQTKIQCVPLVLEPPKKFWTDPVLVLDFQSLYPSIMIAYNLCYSTCLGKVAAQRYKKFGVTHMKGEVFDGQDMIITPNNVAFVKKTTRLGFIPMMMHELLQTRIMVKNSMKLVDKGSSRYHELFVQQLGIKMLCNTTYGYAGAGDTGRMPCNDIADSIVAIARRTLEDAIQFVESHPEWQASVIYGDTDSMMVHLPGRSLEQAFLLGKEIASAVSSRNPRPVELLFEKVYFPMLTLAKKHYAGMKYERPGSTPVFDAKGIETVRTDYCQLSSKILEGALLRLFESRDLSQVFRYLNNKWTKVLNNRYQLKDFILYEKVILGQYKNPPAGIKVSLKNMEIDKMRKPLFGERVAFVIRTGQPGDPVTELAVNPEDFLASQTWTLNLDYYMDKQINKVLDRTLAPVGVDVKVWYKFLPKRKTPLSIESLQPKKAMIRNESKRIDRFFASGLCVVCRKFVNKTLCHGCKSDPQKTVLAIMASMNKRERKLLSLLEVCRGCTGSLDQILCTSLDCPIYHSRLKLEHESFSISKRLIDLSW